MDCQDQLYEEMSRFTHREFLEEYKNDLIGIRNKWVVRKQNLNSIKQVNASERSMTTYNYKEPDIEECKNYIIENKAGSNKFTQFFLKIKLMLTKSKYFESLFPTIKEQKPGVDLYAPMVVFQVLVIVFMIFFFTRMNPDYTAISSDSLAPATFSVGMVFAVFLQIIIIVLDRYLYLSRDYVVIDEVEIEEYDEDESDGDLGRSESITQFDRTNSFDLRSSSANKLMVKGMSKNQVKLKGTTKEKKNLDEETETDEDKDKGEEGDKGGVQLSKTKFNQTLLLKYYLQLFLLIFVHAMVFWYFPIAANTDLMTTPFCQFEDPSASQCNEVFLNWTLAIFYLLYCGYFIASALQIRYGLPELRKGNFSMGGYTPIHKSMFMGFMAAPFVFELKIITDWTFTKTALDLFQWIKFESVYGDLFVAKCTNKPIIAHPLGQKIPGFSKLVMGCGGLTGLILVIAGPLLLFSALNPLSDTNPVLGASLTLNIIANLTDTDEGPTNVYQLFHTDRFITVEDIGDANYKKISSFRAVRNLDRALFQQVQLSNVADATWAISPPARLEIFDKIKKAKTDTNALPINLELVYAFDRDQPAEQQRIDKALPIINILDKNVEGREEIIDNLITALDPNQGCVPETEELKFHITDWFIPTVRLPATIKPKLIFVKELLQNIYIRRKCEVNVATTITSFWWEVYQDKFSPAGPIDGEENGVVFFTWSERVTGSLAAFSIVTFYIVIVLGIGRVIRDVIKVGSEQIFIKDMPKPDSLMLICEGILISRLENNLEREEQLYFILIDIMRSPEIIKMITTSSLKQKENPAIEN